MGNLLAYKRALRGLHSYGPKEIWIAPFTITWKAELRVFWNKVEITLPFNGSNKLLTILHYGVTPSSPLHKALFCHVAGQLKYLIYTFLHGVFKQRKNSETRRTVQMNGGDSAWFYKVENGLHYLSHCWVIAGKKYKRLQFSRHCELFSWHFIACFLHIRCDI